MTKNFPTEEKYGLVQQMCTAAVSISANIADQLRVK
ncbi:MAG: four helix bundle protein [bacterium]